MHPDISLYNVLSNVNGLQFVRYLLSFSPLGIILMIPRLWVMESLLLSKAYPTALMTKYLISLQKNLKKSLVNPDEPGATLFLNFF